MGLSIGVRSTAVTLRILRANMHINTDIRQLFILLFIFKKLSVPYNPHPVYG